MKNTRNADIVGTSGVIMAEEGAFDTSPPPLDLYQEINAFGKIFPKKFVCAHKRY